MDGIYLVNIVYLVNRVSILGGYSTNLEQIYLVNSLPVADKLYLINKVPLVNRVYLVDKIYLVNKYTQ